MGSGGLSFLEDEIKKFDDVRLVIIDTLGKFRPPIKSQQNSYGVDYEHISKIKEIADSYDISVLLIHHLRKTGAADVMDTFSGTLGLTGAADGLLVLVRLTNQVGAELHITGRDVGAAEYALRFEQKTLSWSLIGAADEVRSTAQQQKLYDALKKYAQEDPVTPTDLKDFTGLKIEYIKKILPKMLKGGSVRRIGHGKYIFIGNHDY